ncbi:hypothetical protein [Nocardioides pacificus]
MGYEVLIENLRKQAGRLRTVTDPLTSYDLDLENVTAESIGHTELAEWVVAVGKQCDEAGKALFSGAETLAVSLEFHATQYENAEDGAREAFSHLGPRLSPFPTGPQQ